MMQDLFDTPPPYQEQADGIYLPDMDLSAWPSSYYGRTRRIDLAKFYHDILKASGPAAVAAATSGQTDEQDHQRINRSSSSSSNSSSDSSSSDSDTSDADSNSLLQQFDKWDHIGNGLSTKPKKQVRFTSDAPQVFEYEPEYPLPQIHKDHSLFDDGWPGRTKTAMKSSGFIDFKSKIEAKLGAINDPSLISQLDSSNANVDESTLLYNQENSPLYRGYYRNRKSPLVKKLNLRPIPNEPTLVLDTSPSPSNSYIDSPATPKDGHHLPMLAMGESISTASSSSNVSVSSRWLKTLSRIRSSSK
ncbi:hypothetical protein MAM1_0068c04052 [Mucor ambiguus]|uniref:Uncharacterized protein n=1 Tax=Mucor ambiguus TaxID=91626 RepID=A0A0C9M538_9FUNG|nr:hypothetical protein MAM1_0068c04052 [Mucor ambiguus]